MSPSVVAGIPVLHPSNHHPSSVRCQDSLGRIEVDSVVNRLICLFREFLRFPVIRPNQAQRPVPVMVLEAGGKHVLGAGEQHPLPVQREKVRAFPHLPETVVIRRQHLFIMPRITVRTFKKQNLSAAVRRPVADDAAVGSVLLPPHLGIAEIKPAAAFRDIFLVQNRILIILYIVHSVPHGKALCLDFIITAVCLALLDHACVHQKLPAVRKRNRAAGKASVPVIDFIRSQRRRKIFPMQEIRAHRMPPVHGAPVGIIEHVVLPVMPGEAVGIVHPPGPGGQMEARPLLERNRFPESFLVFTRFP